MWVWPLLFALLEPAPIQRPKDVAPASTEDAAPDPDAEASDDDEPAQEGDGAPAQDSASPDGLTPPPLPPPSDEVPPDPEPIGPPESSPYPDGLLPLERDELLPPLSTTPAPPRDPVALKLRAVEGQFAILTLTADRETRGVVRFAGPADIAVVDRTSGEIELVPRRDVLDARFPGTVDAPARKDTGVGLIAAGAVLASIGTPVFVSGIAFVIVLPDEPPVYAPLMVIGAAALGGGVAMLVHGIRRRKAYTQSRAHTLRARPAGLALRF